MSLLPKETCGLEREKLRGALWLLLLALLAAMPAPAATLVVTSTADTGPGTLRQAILNATATNGIDTISFSLTGSPPFTINVLSALPALDQIIVDGSSQTGYVSSPVVELNGTSAGAGTVGLRLNSGNIVRALAINRFSADGIRTDGASNVIQGCHIGTDVTGTIARGNGQYGIFIFGTSGNRIGGTNAAERNVIGGGNDTGIYVLNPAATGNVIAGNYIGLNAAGTAALSNRTHGITLYSAPGNLIGGSAPGARNVISGNSGSGISINNSAAAGNVIQGNFIGLNAAGTAAVPNQADGITLNSAPTTTLGGTAPVLRNTISGNAKTGILLSAAGSSGNLIAGNYVGTDVTGSNAVPNGYAGLTLSGTGSNLIGGATAAARNLISGNRLDGIYATNTTGLIIQGNFIGMNASGLVALSNGTTGLTLENSRSNSVGGELGTTGNLISGNGTLGLWLLRSNATGNVIRGNLIGTGLYGTNAVGNAGGGLGLTDAANNLIGGFTAAERNVISGNGYPANNGGVFLLGVAAAGNSFFGNYIGTDLAGQFALPNRYEGIYLVSARSNSIGSALAGGGNLISGNVTRGVRLTNSWGNQILGNWIGTRPDGATALANGQFNVEFEAFASHNTVGGLPPNAGNRIAYSGGGFAGVRIRDLATNNAVLGNAIFSNSGLGIDLDINAGVTTNDLCDLDGGANQLQNYPVLQQAYAGGALGIRGVLQSRASTTFRVQFFASPACDASGQGEGAIYLGDTLATTGATCSNTFVVTLPGSVPVGYVLTATATDPANNTSEFSPCLPIAANPRLGLTASGSQVTLAWPGTAPGFTLRSATNLTPPVVWSAVPNAPVVLNGQFTVTLTRDPGPRFYRLNFE